MGSRRNLAAALVFAVAAACSQSPEDRGPTATVPSAPTTAAPAPDPYAVPEVIDVAYVNRVLAGLDAVMGDVVRLVVKTKAIPPEAYDRLRAIYGDDEWLQLAVDGFQDDLFYGLKDYKAEPGNERTTISRLITAEPNCVFGSVERDYSALRSDPTKAKRNQWVALRRVRANAYNSTGWAYVYDGFPEDRTEPANPCAAPAS